MGMGTWEERMSGRARERMAREARAERENDPHAGHHSHLRGTMVECSCGEFGGVTCVAFGEDYDPAKLSCRICGEPGVVTLGA
jgi:hypothetical protein